MYILCRECSHFFKSLFRFRLGIRSDDSIGWTLRQKIAFTLSSDVPVAWEGIHGNRSWYVRNFISASQSTSYTLFFVYAEQDMIHSINRWHTIPHCLIFVPISVLIYFRPSNIWKVNDYRVEITCPRTTALRIISYNGVMVHLALPIYSLVHMKFVVVYFRLFEDRFDL